MTSTSSTSRMNKKGTGRVFGRLFKRKSQHVPLSQQDTCSNTSDDENENNLNQSNHQSNQNQQTPLSTYSPAIDNSMNMSSEKENSVNKNYANNITSGIGKHDNNGDPLISPSRVVTLRKLPLLEQNQQKRSNEMNDGTNQNINESQALIDTDFKDIGTFHSTGDRNPFQKKTWNYLPCNQQELNQQQQLKGKSELQSLATEQSKSKKKKFLNQMIRKNRSPSLDDDTCDNNDGDDDNDNDDNIQIDKDDKNEHTTRNGKKGKSKKDKWKKDKEKHSFQISETPKFTNKSLSPPSNKKTNDTTTTGNSDKMILTRSALSRPFGRTSLPSYLAKQWCVEVSPFYDTSYKCWKYHIFVQREEYIQNSNGAGFLSTIRESNSNIANRRDQNKMNNTSESNKKTPGNSPSSVIQQTLPTVDSLPNNANRDGIAMHQSFTAANVTRTLKDIVWLERALKDEYHGALIFPALSMTLTSGTDWTTAVTLDKGTFERGEWDPFTLSNELLDVVLEEEGFLDLDEAEDDEKRPPFDPKLIADWLNDILNGVRGKGELILNYSTARMVDVIHSESMESFFYKINEPLVDLHFMKKEKRENTWLPLSLDLRNLPFKDRNDDMDDEKCTIRGLMTFPILCLNNMNACNAIDDFRESDPILHRRDKNRSKQQSPDFWQNSILSEMLKVQSYYIGLQRENTLRAMYRLRILLETEALLSAAWKRFAIALSNLFTAGKDIESCKVGDLKGKKKSAKISKDKVDDCLRILARQKVERATPSLKVLSSMLSAYYADFSAVNPSLSAFSDGLKQLKREKEAMAASADENWKQALKAVSPLTLFLDPETVKDSRTIEIEMRLYEQRQSFNEGLMKNSLLQLCNSIDIRVSRMSWKFFKMESGQASLLSNAAEQVHENLVNELQQDNDFEISRGEEEIDLIRRILDLGLKQNYKFYPRPKSCSSSHTGSESDLISENDSSFTEESVNEYNSAHNAITNEILDHAKERIGRWDSKLAISILKAIGVEKPQISMENSTREVRTVQRLAESLRAQIERCRDAISMLTELAYGDEAGRVKEHRQNFLSDLAVVFSGTMYSRSNSPMDTKHFEKILSKIGVNYLDKAGWLTLTQDDDDDFLDYDSIEGINSCGNVAKSYEEIRETGTIDFIKRINGVLVEQSDRIERMESFVYMNCIGIEIEKHFSQSRASALAAWEKKTDITTAINIASKKKLPLLVNELKSKLSTLRHVVSHTTVKEAKERHLGSKALKTELETLASNRFYKLKESSAHGVVKAVLLWAEHEKNVAAKEMTALSIAIREIELSLRNNEKIIQADGGAHLFASSGVG